MKSEKECFQILYIELEMNVNCMVRIEVRKITLEC